MCEKKRPIGGGFLQKKGRNEALYRYHLRHPDMTHSNLGRIFKISRGRVTQILNVNREIENEQEATEGDQGTAG